MCGFVALLNDNEFSIKNLLNSISHRGPDSSKTLTTENWKFGFNRLGIVGDNEFDQPYSENDNVNILVFNGEIYNYKELAANYLPHIKEVRSDTQILYNLLLYCGTSIIQKLDGIFAFIFVETISGTSVVCRDEFGVKPLYFHYKKGKSYFSSEVQPLVKIVKPEYSIVGLIEHFSFGVPLEDRTIYNDISSFEPGTYTIFGRGGEKIKTDTFSFKSESIIKKPLKKTLNDAFDSQCPDIPFGVLFSGGVDSTLILHQTHQNPNMKLALSVNVDQVGMSEASWQNIGFRTMNYIKKSVEIKQDEKTFSLENLTSLISNLDLPISHPNFLGALMLAKEAKENSIKVLLSGEGADEIFMGYRWFIQKEFKNLDALSYIPPDLVTKALGGNIEVAYENINKLNCKNFFITHYLKKWLFRADLTGMAHSVEVRVPFLAGAIVNAAKSISSDEMTDFGATTKSPLKKIVEKVFGGDYANRKKIGFDYPLNDWVGSEYTDYLQENNNIFRSDVIKDICEKKDTHYHYPRLIFLLTAFTVWEKTNQLNFNRGNYE